MLVLHLKLALQLPRVPQLDQFAQHLIQRHKFAHLLRSRIVSVSNVDCSRLLFFGTDDYSILALILHHARKTACVELTEREVILLNLRVADLLLQRVSRQVDIDIHPRLMEDLLEFSDVVLG